ncbi:MAG: DUF3747 domain-containing protein [Cyanothece sp. SIO1E1]|nr:DUF3747 domain-containing protein [Cyanothece sp. SIO1E1]
MQSILRHILILSATTATAAISTLITTPALAAQFQQQEVDQSKLITVAAPAGRISRTSHQLLILEQLSNGRRCWRESGNSPTQVEPLLLEFDFTGICNRSVDSNGYSVRVGGQDLGLQYRLRIVQRQGDLVLVAAPNPGQSGATIEIGRTQGTTNGFAKIELNSGWRLTKRTYKGQTLGHIYLTSDQDLSTLIAAAPTRPTPTPARINPSPVTRRPSPLPPPAPRRPQLPAPPRVERPAANGSSRAAALGFNYRVIVAATTAAEQQRVKAIAPDAFRTQLNGQTVIQAGLFRARRDARELQQRLRRQNLQAQVLPIERAAQPAPTPSPAAESDVLYRVIVPTRSAADEQRVKVAAPGSFRTQVNGQSVVQVGLFRERSTANAIQQRLRRQNLPAQIISVRASTVQLPSERPTNSGRRIPSGRVVVTIDPGHGGRDPGAVGIGGLRETDVVLPIAKQVATLLERQGVQAILTRRDEREIDLEPRLQTAERANSDLFVSIHANAISLSRPEVNGVETFYYTSGSRALAQSIQSSVLRQTNSRNRGVKQARFYVLRTGSMPSALVEVGFVTGREDAPRLRSPAFRTELAEAIAAGILNYVQRAGLN